MTPNRMTLAPLTLDDYNQRFADRHLLHGVVAKWAKDRPEAAALISAETGRVVTWREFDRFTTALACEWLRLGFKKGNYFVTLLPMSADHVLLEYSLFRIGVIAVPLDLRLPAAEVLRVVEMLRPRGFVSLGLYGPIDFREMGRAVATKCQWIEHFFTVSSAEPSEGFAPMPRWPKALRTPLQLRPSACWPKARPIAATPRRRSWRDARPHSAPRAGRIRYDGRWRDRDPARRRRARPCHPPEGAANRRDHRARPCAGRCTLRQRPARRHGAAALRRHADLYAGGRGRRSRHGRHPCDPRRRPPQRRGAPAADHRGDGLALRLSAICR